MVCKKLPPLHNQYPPLPKHLHLFTFLSASCLQHGKQAISACTVQDFVQGARTCEVEHTKEWFKVRSVLPCKNIFAADPTATEWVNLT